MPNPTSREEEQQLMPSDIQFLRHYSAYKGNLEPLDRLLAAHAADKARIAALVEAVQAAETMAANLRGDFITGRTIHREECAKNLLLFCEKMLRVLAAHGGAS